jgi:imidazolonepropionase-like amidohydrolase
VAEARVAIVPTLVQAEHALASPSTLSSWMRREELQQVPAEVRSHWETRVTNISERVREEDWAVVRRGAENRLALVKALHDAGAVVLAGTDTPNPFVVPGTAIHRELALFVAAGLTPKEALATATRDAALFLGQEGEWGTIEPGKRADLVLLAANPLANIAAASKPVRVMVRGKLF